MIFYILLIINIISFSVFAYDKEAAVWKSWRIKESYLKSISYAGSIGTLIAIKLFNHKTRKFKADLGVIQMSALAQVIFFFLYKVYK